MFPEDLKPAIRFIFFTILLSTAILCWVQLVTVPNNNEQLFLGQWECKGQDPIKIILQGDKMIVYNGGVPLLVNHTSDDNKIIDAPPMQLMLMNEQQVMVNGVGLYQRKVK